MTGQLRTTQACHSFDAPCCGTERAEGSIHDGVFKGEAVMKPVVVALAVLALGALALAAWLWTPDKPRAALERDYLEREADMMVIDGVTVHVRDRGSPERPTVLLIHGFGSSLHTWEPWIARLSERWRVLALDLPGSGLSHTDPSGDYSDARTLALILAMMDAKGIEQAVIVGHSIGGRLAWSLAARHPDRVSALVLIAPDGFASPGFSYGKPAEVPASLGVMQFVLPKALLRMNVAPGYGDPSRLTDQTMKRYHDLMLAPGSRHALLERMRQTVLVDPATLLPSITASTLLVWGERDAMIPPDNARDYLRLIPGSQLATLPGLGHVPFEEDSEAALAPVWAFLERMP